MLQVKDLYVTYGKAEKKSVIKYMSWQLETGHVLAVAGPSGCGKSTLIHALAGITPYEGTVTLNDVSLTPLTCSIGLIPQNYGLLPWKTVRENCLFTAGIRGGVKEADEKLPGLCRELGIEDLLNRYPGTLSGGQAQRVAVARAYLMRPELLLMDEPFAALDIAAAAAARSLFLRIWRERGTTTVIVTHRVEDAMYLAHRIAVMDRGGGFRFLCENPWRGIERPSDSAYTALERCITEEIIKADSI